ncbi:hypothetical protein ILUMI_03601 [Ignelater luminosus]|uniref:Uncharacterized protein n=1 Tax=Ignelater luminosus TaxID=2038154 RepID=A0A8K0DAH0_IGNLU|nr:hypothetical protein ILUMI_03601 [Ignelater luminosus]
METNSNSCDDSDQFETVDPYFDGDDVDKDPDYFPVETDLPSTSLFNIEAGALLFHTERNDQLLNEHENTANEAEQRMQSSKKRQEKKERVLSHGKEMCTEQEKFKILRIAKPSVNLVVVKKIKLDERQNIHDSFWKVILELQKNSVVEHINSIPVIDSHYCRQSSTKQYFDASLNMTKLYELYLEYCEAKSIESVKLHYYRNIFSYQFDIDFIKPKKDRFVIKLTRKTREIQTETVF